MSKILLSQAIQFSISLVLLDPYVGPNQALLLLARIELEVMTIKRYYAFTKSPALLELHNQIV